MKKLLTLALLLAAQVAGVSAQQVIKVAEGECWWGAQTVAGRNTPFTTSSARYDLIKDHNGNQAVPFLVSNKGRYIWSDEPFVFQFVDGEINITDAVADIVVSDDAKSKTLKGAFQTAAAKHFPSTGVIPNEMFFSQPQYNTWIELVYDQNQEDVLNYARAIKENGYPTGVLMIDDNWQRQYGNFDFRAEKFPDPKAMIDELHEMGFKVMLWISPFVSPDGPEYRFLRSKGYLFKKPNGAPAIFNWWNGYSAAYDLSNPESYAYLKSEMVRLQEEYGVDGYKLDAGDPHHYATCDFVDFAGNSNLYVHTELWAKLGCEFDFNEFRACWKMAGDRGVQRLRDKEYAWDSLTLLISDMLNAGVMGYAYTCPDMIGGGAFKSFQNIDPDKFDQELIVRSCQIHALMPMMQFSVAPWRILDKEHNDITCHYANLHEQYGDYILDQAHKSSISGEPIVRLMEYEFPNQGFEMCKDQFMLGDKYLVAPMVTKGYERSVKLPKGQWVDELGNKYKGGKSYVIDVPIERLPVFTKR